MQDDFLALLQRLGPDLAAQMTLRTLVLERIAAWEPIGRRQLAARLELPEREIRSVASFLREEGFLNLDAAGMTLTEKAQSLLPSAREFSRAMRGIANMEARLSATLNIDRVCIAAGDYDEDPRVLQDVGRMAAQRVRVLLQNGTTLAVTGGSTMAEVAKYIQSPLPLDVMVVPARGGMGRTVETQANTLAAEIARNVGGHHRLMHLPDHLDAAAMQEMLKLPEVKETLALLQGADVILHGIGRADDMARSREMPLLTYRELLEKGAVAESLGSYYDAEGWPICSVSSVGVELTHVPAGCQMVAVAAGRRKGQAILAVLRSHRHAVLVTDEGAAEEMLRLMEK